MKGQAYSILMTVSLAWASWVSVTLLRLDQDIDRMFLRAGYARTPTASVERYAQSAPPTPQPKPPEIIIREETVRKKGH